MNELIPELKKSLFIENFENFIQDYLELGIDSAMKEGILKEIPIVKSVCSGAKVAFMIHERNMVKNLIIFINELNNGSIDDVKKKEYQYRINNDFKFAEKELSRILILLYQYFDNEKASMLGKFFRAYINEEIIWDKFCEISEVLNRIFIQDIDLLKKIYDGEINEIANREDSFRAERLNSIGLISLSVKTYFSYGPQKLANSFVTMSPLGEIFMKILS